MIEAKFYLDSRRIDKQGRAQIRIRISKQGRSSLLGTGVSVLPRQWDGHMIIDHPNKAVLNSIISTKLATANRTIIERTHDGSLVGKSCKEVMEIIKEEMDPEYALLKEKQRIEVEKEEASFYLFFSDCVSRKMNTGTRQLYSDTLNKIRSFCEENKFDPVDLRYDQVTVDWLNRFEDYCLKTQSQNTASRHLRDIRAVFNTAIDEGKTTNYPFRRRKIKVVESKDKSFSASQLHSLFNCSCYPGGEQEAVDIFKLMFCLIGINPVDLAFLEKTRNGRVEYERRKTHKPYSIRIEPEAKHIIEKYKGEKYLLCILERVPNYKTYFNRMGKTLKKVGKTRIAGKKSVGKAILPDACIGSARTSWATIAQEELDIDREVIAASLGHSTVDVTSTYLRVALKGYRPWRAIGYRRSAQ